MSICFVRRQRLGRGSLNGISPHVPDSKVVRSWMPEDMASIRPDDVVVRWGCTANLPQNVQTINPSRSIHWCADKREGRVEMQDAGVPVPETWFAEAFYADIVTGAAAHVGEFVLRPRVHAQGRRLYTGNSQEIARLINAHNLRDGYVSRLINKVAEYRFFIAFNRVVWCARKTPGNPNQVAWNVAQGGRFDNVRWEDWPIEAAKACLAAAKVSGTDFCGVDVMIDAENKPYVLEVNSAPSQTSVYRQQCVGRMFAYHQNSGNFDHLPDPPVVRTYKSIIHPAIRAPRQ